MAEMPTKIKVGPHWYSVIRKKKSEMPKLDGDRLYALCDPDRLHILIQIGLRVSKVKEYLVHELGHACNFLAGTYGKTLEEEEFVDKLAPHLLQVLQDNPELLEYLTQ